MYSMKTGKYTCDLCEFTGEYDVNDLTNGVIWECEICGIHFCSKCLRDKVGIANFYEIMQSEKVKCPECFYGYGEEGTNANAK